MLKSVSIALLATLLIGSGLFSITKFYVLNQAEKKIEDLLMAHKGIHTYVQQVMHPALYKYKAEGKMKKDFYAPELLSSSFIVRNQHKFYNEERLKRGLPELYYKMAAISPRNPINKADAMEERLIQKFNRNRELKKYQEVLEIKGKKYLYVALPFLANEPRCLKCHGKREDSPQDLQAIYAGEGGFNEKAGDIRAIISMRAPLDREYFTTYIIFSALLCGVVTIVVLFLFNFRLQKRITLGSEHLAESESFLNDVIENIPNMVFVKDAKDLRFVRLNKAGEELLGYKQEELIGKTDHDFFPPEEALFFTEKDREVLTHKKLSDIPEEPIQTRHKGTRILHTQKIPILDKEGEPVFLLGISEDITEDKNALEERQLLEGQLRQAQKMESIGTLAGGIAHDFNNILSAIFGYAELAKEDINEPEKIQKDLDEVLSGARRARDLVRQILTFSRKNDTELQPLRIQSILKESLKLLRSTIPTTIEIKQDINPQCEPVLADPTQIHQVIMNLCTNAYHAMRDTGGILNISLHPVELAKEDLGHKIDFASGSYLKLEIQDTGIGMNREVQEKIFEPYFTTKGKKEGTGLGLSVVHGIITSLKGHIYVYSEIGRGTTFKIYLPTIVDTGSATAMQTEEISPIPTGHERILLVDDDADIVQLNHTILAGLGYHITPFTRGMDALQAFQQNPSQFDLLLTDMTMPDMTGTELAKEILTIRPEMPIVLSTGFSELVNAEKAKSLGIRAFTTKPVSRKDLAQTVRNVLDGILSSDLLV